MTRIPRVKREDLSAEDQKIWDHIHTARTGGGGPYSILLHVPPLASHVAATEDYFRLHSGLPDADREIVILTAARELEARYPWTRHEVRAHKAGVRPAVIEALRTQAPLDRFSGREKLLVELTRALLRDRNLTDDLFARAAAELGRERLIEAVGLLGHYITIGMIARIFDIEVPEGSNTF